MPNIEASEPLAISQPETHNRDKDSASAPPPRWDGPRAVDPGKLNTLELPFDGPPVSLVVEGLPLPAFINEVYGNLLGLAFNLDQGIERQKDLVTLRIPEKRPPNEIYRIATEILANYGIEVAIKDQGYAEFSVSRNPAATGEPPLLVSGLTLPSVPVGHRPIFQLVPLRVVSNLEASQWLRQAFKDQGLEVLDDRTRNSLMLRGPAPLIAEALKAVAVLDQPFMRGRHSVMIEPLFLSADDLTKALEKVLSAEGIAVSLDPRTGSVYLLPIEQAGLLLIFAADRDVLDHVQDWAKQLDTLGDMGEQTGLFLYRVQNTAAADLAKVAEGLLGDLAAIEKKPGALTPAPGALTDAAKKTPSDGSASDGSSRLVVDDARNVIVFSGSGALWKKLVSVLQRLDTPLKQVLVEVTVAEITLSDDHTLGVEWVLESAGVSGFRGELQSSGLGLGSAGLSWYPLSNSGATRLLLNAFASTQRITILQSPRLMVRSGETATIDVGSEVPVITSQGTASDLPNSDGGASILQEIQYRSTGVQLNVTPTVHGGRNVDLQISQSVSEAQPNTISSVSSPIILNRSIQTALTLADGGSVLLGGMITKTSQSGNSGIPGLRDIPLLGRLFRVDDHQDSRTELLVLIVPYILDNQQEAEQVSRAFQQRLSF